MPVVTVIGDGQLARMMQTEAIELGQSVRLLAGARDASASQVAADVVIGDYTDIDDLRRALKGADVVTFDHEHVPTEHLRQLISEGVNVQPGPDALVNAQDKLVMRKRLRELGARFHPSPPLRASRMLKASSRRLTARCVSRPGAVVMTGMVSGSRLIWKSFVNSSQSCLMPTPR